MSPEFRPVTRVQRSDPSPVDRDVGILNAQSHRDMMRFFREHGWHLKEPCEEYPQEEPQLFVQLVFRARAEDLIGESKAAELLRVSLEEFHRIRDVSNGSDALRA